MSRARWVVSVASPDGTQRTWRFAEGEVRIGRDASCGVRLDDPRLSGVHLRLLLGDTAPRILDTGSRHGARLDASPLVPNQPATLDTTSVVEFVDHRLTVTSDLEGGWTTDSRGTAERQDAVRRGVEGLRAALEQGRAPVDGAEVSSPRPETEPPGGIRRAWSRERLYTTAMALAVLGGLLALAAALRALWAP